MKPMLWNNCYDSSWKGAITNQSFAHPAKMSRALLERIILHGFEMGYWKRGDRIGDCFGGVGTTGIICAYNGLEAVLCELEPKFIGFANENFAMHKRHWETMGLPLPRILQGDSRKFDEHVAAIVSSPPYADGLGHGGGPCTEKDVAKKISYMKQGYGASEGQIENLKSGAVEAVISSRINKNGYTPSDKVLKQGGREHELGATYQGRGGQREAGNIETLKEGTVQGVISSPPYSDIAAGAGGLNTKPAKKPGQQSGRKADSASQDTDQRYGTSAGQISQLKGGSVDGVVSSPPFMGSGLGAKTESRARQVITTGTPTHKNGAVIGETTYGDSEGQIGKETGETYWMAVSAVYHACFRCIRPGGVIVIVVKDYVQRGKRVHLCNDTLRLLEHIGFVPIERIHAMLVTETVENGLFGEERTKRQRKSFFRRLYEAKLPEEDERRIDFEEILFLKRP